MRFLGILAWLMACACAYAQAGPAQTGKLRVACDPSRSELRAYDPGRVQWPAAQPGERLREIEWQGLVIHGKREVNGFNLRTGSRKVTVGCGRVRLVVAEGYYSASPGGRSGIFIYPDLQLFLGGKKLAHLQLDAGEDTMDTTGECAERADCPHTVRLLACASEVTADGACAASAGAGAVRVYVQRWWSDDGGATHSRIDELK